MVLDVTAIGTVHRREVLTARGPASATRSTSLGSLGDAAIGLMRLQNDDTDLVRPPIAGPPGAALQAGLLLGEIAQLRAAWISVTAGDGVRQIATASSVGIDGRGARSIRGESGVARAIAMDLLTSRLREATILS